MVKATMKKKIIIILGIIMLLTMTIPAQQINMEGYQTQGSPTLHLLIQDLRNVPVEYRQPLIVLYFLSVHAGDT